MRKVTLVLIVFAVLLAVYAVVKILPLSSGSGITAPNAPTAATEVPLLIKGLTNENYEARKTAILGLERITGVVFQYDPNHLTEELQKAAAVYRQWWDEVKDAQEADWYIAALGRRQCMNRAELVRKLVDGRVSNVVEFARKAVAEKHPDRAYFLQSIYALGEFEDTESVDSLIKVLKGSDRHAASQAAEALGKIGDRRALGHLFFALDSKELGLQAASAHAISLVSPVDAEEAFLKLLKSDDLPARAIGIDGLGRFGTDKALRPLVKLLGGPLKKKVHRTLKKISKKDLPPDADAWQKFIDDGRRQ